MANHTAQSQHPARPEPKADRAEPARAVSAVPAPRGLPVAATVLGVSASAVYVLAATLGPVVTRAGLDGWVWRPAVELGLAEPGAAAAGIVTHSGVVGAALATGAATAALLASGLLAVPAVAIRRTGLAVLTVWSASWLFMVFAALLSGDSEPLAAAAAVIGLLHLLCLFFVPGNDRQKRLFFCQFEGSRLPNAGCTPCQHHLSAVKRSSRRFPESPAQVISKSAEHQHSRHNGMVCQIIQPAGAGLKALFFSGRFFCVPGIMNRSGM